MPVSRGAWEASIEALKENTRAEKQAVAAPTPVPDQKSKAERAAGFLGGLTGGAASQISERQRKQKAILDSLQ